MTMNKIKFVILITSVTFYIQRLNQYVVYFMITSKTNATYPQTTKLNVGTVNNVRSLLAREVL